ncbi:REXO2 [Symbiodinium necroappetens]|uniref:REXO2 protein n=1 Tax=Symbiodinium necroappetens TaxID=1628268 RepID=A0A812VWE6_9DINO|nr:REXO2 [Symbiodinium necroappetens]
MGLQARLSSGSFAAKELQKLSAEAQNLSKGVQINAALFSTLQTALDEGYVGLAGAQADQALETLLSSEMWKDRDWKSIQPSELRELEIRAEEATKAGRDRLAEPLQTALEVGQCSVELAAAMRSNDAEKLEACLDKARQLGFNRLEEVQRRLQNMRCSMEGRRGLRRPVRAAESPTLLPSSAPAEQNPPFQEENARKMWPSPADNSEPNGQDQLLRYEEHDQQVRCTNLIFIDLETTSGFYDFEEMPQILEVAIIITDRHLNELDRGHWVVGGFSRKDLESLGEFHKVLWQFKCEVMGSQPPIAATCRRTFEILNPEAAFHL